MPPAAGAQGMDGGAAVLVADAPVPVGADGAKEFEHLQTRADAETMLSMLVALFPEGQGGGARGARAGAAGAVGGGRSSGIGGSRFAWVRPEDVPASPSRSSLSFRESLVHEDHLTKVLQEQLAGACSVDSAPRAAPVCGGSPAPARSCRSRVRSAGLAGTARIAREGRALRRPRARSAPGLDVTVDRSFLHDGAGGDDGHLYSRRIFLTAPEGAPHGLAGHRVAHAILHTNLDRLPVAVRDGVRSEKVSCRVLVVSCSW